MGILRSGLLTGQVRACSPEASANAFGYATYFAVPLNMRPAVDAHLSTCRAEAAAYTEAHGTAEEKAALAEYESNYGAIETQDTLIDSGPPPGVLSQLGPATRDFFYWAGEKIAAPFRIPEAAWIAAGVAVTGLAAYLIYRATRKTT